MKENFLNLLKGTEIQVQEAQKVPNKLDPKHTTRHIIITLPKIKDKERILKAAGEKETVTYKGFPRRLSAEFLNLTGKKVLEVFKIMKGKGPTSKITLPSKAII